MMMIWAQGVGQAPSPGSYFLSVVLPPPAPIGMPGSPARKDSVLTIKTVEHKAKAVADRPASQALMPRSSFASTSSLRSDGAPPGARCYPRDSRHGC